MAGAWCADGVNRNVGVPVGVEIAEDHDPLSPIAGLRDPLHDPLRVGQEARKFDSCPRGRNLPVRLTPLKGYDRNAVRSQSFE